MTRKVAICGSSSFPLDAAVGAQVVDTILGFGEDVLILTRGAGAFDAFVSTVALVLGRRCFNYPGSSSNWQRDIELAFDANELVAFLDPAVLDNPKTGTAHLIECALAAGKPVRVATPVEGTLVWARAS